MKFGTCGFSASLGTGTSGSGSAATRAVTLDADKLFSSELVAMKQGCCRCWKKGNPPCLCPSPSLSSSRTHARAHAGSCFREKELQPESQTQD